MIEKTKSRTKVITARVPEKVYNDLHKLTEKNGLSVSEFVQNNTMKALYTDIYNKNKVPESVIQTKVDQEAVDTIISLSGGATLGVGVYYLVKEYVKDNHPNEDSEALGLAAGVAIGLLTTMGLLSLLKSK
jgi:hypothetical protein